MLLSQMKNLKLNYHMLESCNYNCKFCFARYKKEKILFLDDMKIIISKIADCGYFSAINFAGGEPLLLKELPQIVRYAKQKGLITSVITNGSLLDEEKLKKLLPHLDSIGISFHSICNETKKKIGFCDKNKNTISNEKLQKIVSFIKNNSNCKIKLNTVVNAYNKDEIIAPFIASLYIQRWKALRCQPFGSNAKMLISDKEWNKFCINNSSVKGAVFENTMKDTYIMINPHGKLLKESLSGLGYDEVGSVFEYSIKELLLAYSLDVKEYHKRYQAQKFGA